jgi:hypothetical protein
MQKKKILALLIAVIIIPLSFLVVFNLPAPSVQSPSQNSNWLEGWNYRKSHEIQGSQGAGTDYQIKVTAYYDKGTDYGSNVYLNSKSQPDFSDVRFTGGDGLALLDYWVETKVDANYAVFWVKVNGNLDTNQTIYVYYGNSTVTSASDMKKTFPFSDDFSGNSLDSSNWRTFGNGKITVANGICTLETTTNDRGWIYILGKTQFGTNYAVRFSSMVIEQGEFRWTHHGFATIYNASDNSGGRIDEYPNYVTASQEATYYGWSFRSRAFQNTSRLDLSSHAPAVGVYYTYEIQRNGTTNDILKCNDVFQGSLSTNIPTVNMGAMFSVDHGDGILYSVTAMDWVFIHKYVADEPVQGTWGNIETVLPSNIFGIKI